MVSMSNTAEKKLILSRLLPFYRELLTENQQRMVSLFADEDLSLSEIAEQYHVSRQSVHDAITKAEKQMTDFESKLRLCEQYEETSTILTLCSEQLAMILSLALQDSVQEEIAKVKRMIDDLRNKEDS